MGRAIFSRMKLIITISEIVGFKTGLLLSENDIRERLAEYSDYIDGDNEEIVAARSEIAEEMINSLIHQVTGLPFTDPHLNIIGLWKKYSNRPEHEKLFGEIIKLFNESYKILKNQNPQKNEPIDVTPFIDLVIAKYGLGIPLKMALEYVDSIQMSVQMNPLSRVRSVDWKDTVELSSLFKSESLDTYYGKFFDQRFIDYLNKNFNDIDKINWRKFEGLTAEFFDREGFSVKIGPGRNDGGIDVRVWSDENEKEKPPLILIQCKRQKEKIDKVIVKALWADVQDEAARSGLIVTSSSMSTGAERVSTARAYPIRFADRMTLKEWIFKMRTPNTGIFLGE